MLSIKELTSLLNLLNDDKPLEVQAVTFYRLCPKQEHFKYCCSIYLLIQNGVLESFNARITSYYLIYDLYKSDITQNPFLPIFIEKIQRNSVDIVERNFIYLLLSNGTKELGKNTPSEIQSKNDLKQTITYTLNINNLIEEYNSKQPSIVSSFKRVGITPPVIINPDKNPLNPSQSSAIIDSNETKSEVFSKLLVVDSFELQFVRVSPPILTPTFDELFWLNPEEEKDLEWDYNMGNDLLSISSLTSSDMLSSAKNLLIKSFNTPMSDDNVDTIKRCIEEDPKIILSCGLTPEKLPSLVENNPSIAVDVLLRLYSTNQIQLYLTVLAKMTMTLHSMEVVNQLTNAVTLPKDVLSQFVNNCLEGCRNIKDRINQSRMVRLVCVFLQSLMNNRLIDENQYVSIQSFCLEFTKTKEANALYRSLKAYEQNKSKF